MACGIGMVSNKVVNEATTSNSTVAVYPINDMAIYLLLNHNIPVSKTKRMIRKLGVKRVFYLAVSKGYLSREVKQ